MFFGHFTLTPPHKVKTSCLSGNSDGDGKGSNSCYFLGMSKIRLSIPRKKNKKANDFIFVNRIKISIFATQ